MTFLINFLCWKMCRWLMYGGNCKLTHWAYWLYYTQYPLDNRENKKLAKCLSEPNLRKYLAKISTYTRAYTVWWPKMRVSTGILLWKKNTSGHRYCNTSVRQYWNTYVPVSLAIRQYCYVLDPENIPEFGNTDRLYCQILEHSSIWDFSGTLFVFISNEKTLVN